MRPDSPAPRWRPAPFVAAVAAAHVPLALAWWSWPSAWPWWAAALVLLHAAITAAGLLPRCRLLGRNWVRLPAAAARAGAVAITIDDGPDPAVTPRVLDVLDAHGGAKATFFCIGRLVDAHPALAREIVARGHALENHSHAHRHHFSLLGVRGFRRELAAGQRSIEAATGQRPRFFRAPAGLRNPFLDPALHAEGLTLATWTRRGYDTRRGNPQQVLAALTRNLAAGDILLLHDGHAARTPQGEPVILAVLPALLDAVRARGLHPITLPQAQALPETP